MRKVALVTLVAAVFAATVHETAAQTSLSTRAATQSCLTNLPNAVVGLPPAKPPAPSLLFVHALTRDDIAVLAYADPSHPHTQLAVWFGDSNGRYEGVVLSFFKTAADARAASRSLTGLYGGKVLLNVVVTWAQKGMPDATVRDAILGCVQAGPSRATPQPAPAASLATFAGAWGGHTRDLTIAASGRGSEQTDDGCCTRVYRMTFQILSVSGTVTRATAQYRVVAYRRYETEAKAVRVGQHGKQRLRDGILTNTLSGVFFCSDPAWSTTGACGA